jgi:hypothetical protein
VVAKGNAAMPTHLTATPSELSSSTQQLGVAHAPSPHGGRSDEDALRIEVAIAIEILASDREVSLAGSIALRINRA